MDGLTLSLQRVINHPALMGIDCWPGAASPHGDHVLFTRGSTLIVVSLAIGSVQHWDQQPVLARDRDLLSGRACWAANGVAVQCSRGSQDWLRFLSFV